MELFILNVHATGLDKPLVSFVALKPHTYIPKIGNERHLNHISTFVDETPIRAIIGLSSRLY